MPLMAWLKLRTGWRTWQLEACFVALVLSAVALVSRKGAIEWLGVAAVLITWMHASVADRLAAQPHAVECHAWARRYWIAKECLWFVYFAWLGAWSALAGVVLFLAYTQWREAWRARHAISAERAA